MMKRTLLSALSALSLLAASSARAQPPLYLVNGRERADVADIPPSADNYRLWHVDGGTFTPVEA